MRRFNLFREANEGFAKLVTLLSSIGSSSEDITERVIMLIGDYCLCPNRSVDVIMDVAEMNLKYYESYRRILKRIADIQGL